ncbi:MAG: MBL fold metallo-hydrolase [Bacteroidetes bacterium]|nr:MBL fold metallo-hydrolase [Bacteroidota bacterium]
MKITFLGSGTSQGMPVIACECEVCASTDAKDNRLRVSIMIETEGKVFVIDAGPDFRQQMLREKVKKLNAIVFTHEHKDHIAGLDDVRAFNYITKKPAEIYASDLVQVALKREFHYVFSGIDYPGIPQLNLHTINNSPFEIEGVKFIPISVLHYKLPVYGFRIGDFTYITDANYISEEELEKVKGSKILVLNALRKEKHISHFTLDEAVDLIKKVKPEKAYLTHISHMMGKHADVSKELPDGIELAYDGLNFEV